MYRSFPCLWKKSDPQCHNTVKRENGYKIWLEKYNEYNSNATKQRVLRTINNLFFVYNKEYKEIK
jgi:hypothetical protein